MSDMNLLVHKTKYCKIIAIRFQMLYNINVHYPHSHRRCNFVKRLLLQVDDRGNITIPAELRKKWNIEAGDYLVIDPEDKNINKANIFTDEELQDPKIIELLLSLGKEAKEDYYKGNTSKLNDYVAESNENDEY